MSLPLGTDTSTPSMLSVTTPPGPGSRAWQSCGTVSSRRRLGPDGRGGAVEGAATVGQVGDVLVAEVLDRARDRARRTVTEGAEAAAEDVSQMSRSLSRSSSVPSPVLEPAEDLLEPPVPRGTGCTCRTTRACRSRSSGRRPAPRTPSRRTPGGCGCRASSPAVATDSKSSGTPRCSAVKIGVEDRPGVQNFSSLSGSRIPPARSMSSRIVTPRGASNWPGFFTCPERLKMPKPVDFSVPMPVNQSTPSRTIAGDRGDRLDVVDRGGAGRTGRLRRGTAACCGAGRGGPRGCRGARSPHRRCRRRRRRAR